MDLPSRLPPTEQPNPLSQDLDRLDPLELARLMNRQDAGVPAAVAEALPQIAQAIQAIAAAMAQGGRLFYQGAGTSGRLAALDAAELGPTFSLEPGRAIALIAGGPVALTQAVEGAEDDADQGTADLAAHDFHPPDVLVALAASGRTPYVLGGLRHANRLGAVTIGVACNPDTPLLAEAHIPILVLTGPEVLAGSTRLKAGTAQKLVLNMLSTGAMVRLGKVYGNRMVDVQPANQKLRNRALGMVMELVGVDEGRARALLDASGWQVKVAVVMGLAQVDADRARAALDAAGGRIREALARLGQM